jgi:hypothetical protein
MTKLGRSAAVHRTCHLGSLFVIEVLSESDLLVLFAERGPDQGTVGELPSKNCPRHLGAVHTISSDPRTDTPGDRPVTLINGPCGRPRPLAWHAFVRPDTLINSGPGPDRKPNRSS